MYIRRRIRLRLVWMFAGRSIVGFTLWSTVVTLAHALAVRAGLDGVGIPFQPVSTVGIAVAFLIGFKNSQSYDRFSEGRRLWGGILNMSRTFSNEVLSYVRAAPPGRPLEEVHQSLLYRHIAWVHALRLQLRRTTVFDRDNLSYVPDLRLTPKDAGAELLRELLGEKETFATLCCANSAAYLVRAQGEELAALHQAGLLNDIQQSALMNTLRELYNLQGGCERIKNTPFPRQFAYFSSVFVKIFNIMLPFGVITEFERLHRPGYVWLTIPVSVVISWMFTTIEITGDSTEDPFENYINDVPMTAICRTIEIDIRQMLGEGAVPPPLEPMDDILL